MTVVVCDAGRTKGKKALMTAGNGGIGLASARLLIHHKRGEMHHA
jgi:hypothetical protein